MLTALFFSCASSGDNSDSKLLLDSHAVLGEGAIWNHSENKYYWVDIEQGILHSYHPADCKQEHFELGHRAGTVVPEEPGTVIVALENGIHRFDPVTGELTFLLNPESDLEDMRYNDGKCDPSGRFWVGSMAVRGERKNRASLYRMDNDTTITRVLENITVSNGICWSADETKMYYTDSPTKEIWQFDYDRNTGNISNKKVVIKTGDGMGVPDGMAIDSEGMLWVAHYGGSGVYCWNPRTGQLLRKIHVPARNVTSCAFGGKDLKSLFITTAGGSGDKSDNSPDGNVFVARPGVIGTKANFYRPGQ